MRPLCLAGDGGCALVEERVLYIKCGFPICRVFFCTVASKVTLKREWDSAKRLRLNVGRAGMQGCYSKRKCVDVHTKRGRLYPLHRYRAGVVCSLLSETELLY